MRRWPRRRATGLARLGGRPVAFLANNPARGAGALDAAGAIKATELIETANTFGLPVALLCDNLGVLAGLRAEREGVIKWGGRMFLAMRRMRSPKISVLMRKGFGFGLAIREEPGEAEASGSGRMGRWRIDAGDLRSMHPGDRSARLGRLADRA